MSRPIPPLTPIDDLAYINARKRRCRDLADVAFDALMQKLPHDGVMNPDIPMRLAETAYAYAAAMIEVGKEFE